MLDLENNGKRATGALELLPPQPFYTLRSFPFLIRSKIKNAKLLGKAYDGTTCTPAGILYFCGRKIIIPYS